MTTNYNTNQHPQTALTKTTSKKNNRKRKRSIRWFNPLYSEHVASNIGKQFLKLLDMCFPPTNKLHKILNRNKVKLSYRMLMYAKHKTNHIKPQQNNILIVMNHVGISS